MGGPGRRIRGQPRDSAPGTSAAPASLRQTSRRALTDRPAARTLRRDAARGAARGAARDAADAPGGAAPALEDRVPSRPGPGRARREGRHRRMAIGPDRERPAPGPAGSRRSTARGVRCSAASRRGGRGRARGDLPRGARSRVADPRSVGASDAAPSCLPLGRGCLARCAAAARPHRRRRLARPGPGLWRGNRSSGGGGGGARGGEVPPANPLEGRSRQGL